MMVVRLSGLRDNWCEAVTAFRSAEDEGAARVTVTVALWEEA